MIVSFLLGVFTTYKTINSNSKVYSNFQISKHQSISFVYIRNSLDRIIGDITHVADELRSVGIKDIKDVDYSLNDSMSYLLKLRHYYLPMTEIRQLIFDAGSLLSSGKTSKANRKLERIQKLIKKIRDFDGALLSNKVEDLYLMIDDVQYHLKTSPEVATVKLNNAGRKANYMLLKGELILSGVQFRNKSN